MPNREDCVNPVLCDRCGEWYSLYDVTGCCGNYYCDENCLPEHECGVPCTNCGNYEFDGDYYYCDECDDYRCTGCGPCSRYGRCRRNRRDSRVRCYSHKPEPIFKGDMSDVMMGLELEVAGSQRAICDAVEYVNTECGHLYVKEDSSIPNGAEIVSHPQTLDWLNCNFGYRTMLSQLNSNGCDIPNDEHGLHIHVSRKSFSDRRDIGEVVPHKLRWLLFMSRNGEPLTKLARRESGQWAAFVPPRSGELLAQAKAPYYSGSRYRAINCLPDHTYELRFFLATLDYGEFMAALELVDASVKYTASITSGDILKSDALSWRAFIAWACNQGHRYGHLVRQALFCQTLVPTHEGDN